MLQSEQIYSIQCTMPIGFDKPCSTHDLIILKCFFYFAFCCIQLLCVAVELNSIFSLLVLRKHQLQAASLCSIKLVVGRLY